MSTTATRSYLVCATPRSGSTLLCDALEQTGVAGRPKEFFEARPDTGVPRRGSEWFEDARGLDLSSLLAHVDAAEPTSPPYSDLRGLSEADHLARTLADGTTPNGVFAAKIMWDHVDDPHVFFTGVLGHPPKWVWVRRYDTARQAVSLWRAIQTGAWRKDGAGGPRPDPQFSFEAIDHLVTMLKDHDTAWAQFFAGRGIEPISFRYRDVAADPAAATREVLAHVGITEPPERLPEPRLERQADELSDAWLARYNDARSASAT